MSDQPVIIEAALNGATAKSRNPNVPRTPDEIAADAVRCLDVGATVIHNHTDDPPLGGSGAHDAAPYIASWRRILDERSDAILYPTMAGGGPHATIEQRFAHQEALAEAGLLSMALVDPGSTNIGLADDQGLPQPVDWIYGNTYRDIRYMFAWCERTGTGASISIFEPGFLRVVLAYHARAVCPRAPSASCISAPTTRSVSAFHQRRWHSRHISPCFKEPACPGWCQPTVETSLNAASPGSRSNEEVTFRSDWSLMPANANRRTLI